MLFPECLLDWVKAALSSHALDRRYFLAVGLRGQHHAALDGRSIELNRAGAALTGLATDMRARKAKLVSQEMHEQRSRFHVKRVFGSVD
jgi:hypothetical protein